ncbi:MAG: adenylyl-sulfate kinase [Nitrososphaera sp.]|nr:adenylyl-sulfate kinase [Nitrososphaera sp.]
MTRKGFVVWLTGLSGSGKTTIGRSLHEQLHELGLRAELLDGDEVRKQLSPDLGFTKNDREMHARRVVYLSKLLAKNGIVTLVSLIAPYRSFREHARKEIGDYVEVYVKTPLETCVERDPKGLYKKALRGEITDMTGIQDPYEEPLNPEVVIDTERLTVRESAHKILAKLNELGYLPQVNFNV